MAIKNTEVVNTTSKYIVKSTGVKSESNQEMIEGGVESLTEGNTFNTAFNHFLVTFTLNTC